MIDSCFVPGRNIVSRSIAGDTILVPVSGDTASMECIYGLNELGECIWKLLDGKRSLKQVVQAVVELYDVDPAQAERDVTEFVSVLKQEGLVETAEASEK